MINKVIFKNKPVLVISDDEKKYHKISFGITKAKLILDNIKSIEEFIKENETIT